MMTANSLFSCILIYVHARIFHQENMSVGFIPPYIPLLYSKIGVYRRIHNFLIFDLKHRLCVLSEAVLTCTHNEAVLTCTHNLCFEQK